MGSGQETKTSTTAVAVAAANGVGHMLVLGLRGGRWNARGNIMLPTKRWHLGLGCTDLLSPVYEVFNHLADACKMPHAIFMLPADGSNWMSFTAQRFTAPECHGLDLVVVRHVLV